MSLLLTVLISAAFAQSQQDIRTLAPPKPTERPSVIAQPETTGTLNSIGGDWARKQIHLSTGGADQAFLDTTNSKLQKFFDRKPVAEGMARDPAATQPSRPLVDSVQMPKLGELELGFRGHTKLTCDFANGAELNLSKPVLRDVDLRLHHESDVNSVQLQLSW